MTVRTTRDESTSRIKWNDIRRVGPLLIMALIAVVLTNPSFVRATNSVGSAPSPFDPCASAALVTGVDITDVGGDPCNPCVSGYVEYNGACCPEEVLLVAVVAPTGCTTAEDEPAAEPAAEDEPAAEEAPVVVRKPPPSPGAIMGPIWLGAIQVDVLAPGLVELEFPDLLDAFIGGHVVKVYDADGVLVYEDGLPANGKMLVFSSNAPMTVKTTLTTLATYTEIVAPVASAS